MKLTEYGAVSGSDHTPLGKLQDFAMGPKWACGRAGRVREKSSHLGGRIPIVAITAHAMKGDRARCLATVMNDYLTKPVERARLAATIEKWLDQH